MNHQKTTKRWILIGFAALMTAGLMMALSACGGGNTGTSPEGEPENQNTAKESQTVPENVWKEAYREVLEDHEEAIRSYEKQEYGGGVERSTSLCDINRDGVPELLFFAWKKDNYSAELQIYTYLEDHAKKIRYSCTSPSGDDDHFAVNDAPYSDLFVAGGTKYAIYTERGSNIFTIYSTITDENILMQMNRFEMNATGDVTELEELGYNYSFVKYDGDTYLYSTDEVDYEDADLYRNGKIISSSEFLKAYEASRDAMDLVVFCSENGWRGDDKVLWDKAENGKNCSMSFDSMMEQLQTGEEDGMNDSQTGDDAADAEYGQIMEKVLDAYGDGDMKTAWEYNAKLPEKAGNVNVPSTEQIAYAEVKNQLQSEGRLPDYGPVEFFSDVDNDGSQEYLIVTGTCEADYMLQCYKYESGDAIWIGEAGAGHSTFHRYPDHKGVIQEYGHMGEEGINLITFSSGQGHCEEIGSRTDIPESEDYLPLGLRLGD